MLPDSRVISIESSFSVTLPTRFHCFNSPNVSFTSAILQLLSKTLLTVYTPKKKYKIAKWYVAKSTTSFPFSLFNRSINRQTYVMVICYQYLLEETRKREKKLDDSVSQSRWPVIAKGKHFSLIYFAVPVVVTRHYHCEHDKIVREKQLATCDFLWRCWFRVEGDTVGIDPWPWQ